MSTRIAHFLWACFILTAATTARSEPPATKPTGKTFDFTRDALPSDLPTVGVLRFGMSFKEVMVALGESRVPVEEVRDFKAQEEKARTIEKDITYVKRQFHNQ